ncbi:MAG TPA: hypothetical protein VLF90_00465 [Patescibacteria group bacterium]|nr:hypothetical protein [Patescibacteria group bacterium]
MSKSTPETAINHWNKIEAAYLTESIRGLVSFILEIEQSGVVNSLEIARQHKQDRQRSKDERGETPMHIPINWSVLNYSGANEALTTIEQDFVHLTGLPDPSHPVFGSLKPRFVDVVYVNGGIDVTLPKCRIPEDSQQTINIGKAVGLTIVADTGRYPVWGND